MSFFVPLNTAEEWQSFKASAQTGTLSNSVQLVYGCNAERVPSPCGGTVSVPVKRNGQTATAIVTPQMTATYTCTALTGCGTWNLTKTTGSCPINGACGSSDGASLTQAPSADLCHTGTASAVTGSGPWSWSCRGQYGGITTQCTASQTPQGCEPNIQITGYGPCSAACGGGSRDVYRDDGCANSSTSSEACNTQACTCTSTGWIYDGAGPCSAPCGGGTQTHSWHDNCGASTNATQACNTQACTCTSTGWVYDGASECSASCGGGTQTHSWHDNCGASTSATQACNTQACSCSEMSYGCGVELY